MGRDPRQELADRAVREAVAETDRVNAPALVALVEELTPEQERAFWTELEQRWNR